MITLLILVFIAGIAKAVMDTLMFHYSGSIFNTKFINPFWDTSISWKNKYSDPIKLIRKKWFNIIPIPVLQSDGWHLFQSLFLTSMFIALILYSPITEYKIIDLILLRLVFGMGFVLFYNKILLK
jgi:hypothetical protein